MNEDTKPSATVDNGRGGPGWRYQCRKCGHKVGLETAFPEKCPGCGVGGWWGHLVAESPHVITPETILLPNGQTESRQTPLELGGLRVSPRGDGHRGRGRPKSIISNEVLAGFVSQGLGCKVIARKLTAQGTPIHYTTVARELKRYKGKSITQGMNQNEKGGDSQCQG